MDLGTANPCIQVCTAALVLGREDGKVEVQFRAFMIGFLMEWSGELQAPAVLSFFRGMALQYP